jgi:hypothetical protein
MQYCIKCYYVTVIAFYFSSNIYRTETRGGSRIFKLGGGAHLKKLRRAEGGAKNFGVFRVKNHDFTQKNHIFFHLRREERKFLGYFVWKIRLWFLVQHKKCNVVFFFIVPPHVQRLKTFFSLFLLFLYVETLLLISFV